MKYLISIYILFVAGLVFGIILLLTLLFTFILPPTTLKVKFRVPISAAQVEELSVTELGNLTREKIQGLIE